ncbi:hypothetical protein O9929_20090 [Vibrio lentus]|nr:hypothetical protein [Vibrio lentus]
MVSASLASANFSFAASEQKEIGDLVTTSLSKPIPDQYHSWKMTSESEVIEDALKEDPNMFIMYWPCHKDYNSTRPLMPLTM